MKKILGLVASQRKLANGEILLKEAAAATGEEYQLDIIKLPELQIKLCRACYVCLAPGKKCPLDDDLYFLLEKIKEADGIIISAPCYALGPAAVTKLFGDRIIAVAQYIEHLWGKPCIVIATAGIENWQGYTLTAINTMMRFMGLDLKDSEMFIGALPGEGIIGNGALERIREMGRALFGKGRSSKDGECPSCWSDLWKFTDPGKAKCAICGQEAQIGQDGKLSFGTASDMFSKEHLQEHFQVWLRGKVKEFMARREELANIRNRYKD